MGYVILARNEEYVFNAIDQKVSFTSLDLAKEAMLLKLNEYCLTSNQIHPQDSGILRRKDIFELCVPQTKLNEAFKILSEKEGFSPAKEIIHEIAFSFIDCDGNFFKEFQTSGFDPRLWELYLYAYLNEEKFNINREHSSPDYLCQKGSQEICIEATTVNPPDLISQKKDHHDNQDQSKIFEYQCIKYSKVLKKKLYKRYWEKPHIKKNL